MQFDIVTIFPAMIEQALAAGIVGRAIERGTLNVRVHDLRDFTTDRHRVVDDVPYGGGPGMVLKPEPIFRALDAIEAERGTPLTVILTSPQGMRFTQVEAQRLSGLEHIVLLCGRYEGCDGSAKASAERMLKVPDVLLSGNHAEIRRWRKREALIRTLDRRPDLLEDASLDDEEEQMLRELQDGRIGELRKGKAEGDGS